MDEFYNCPVCGEAAFAVSKSPLRIIHECDCAILEPTRYSEGLQSITRRLGAPLAFQAALEANQRRYAAYELEGYQPRTPQQAAALKAMSELEPGRLVFLGGPAGSGKTRLAVGTAKRLAREHGLTAAFYSEAELVNTLRRAAGREVPRPDLDHPDILILDDVGKAAEGRDHWMEAFYALVEHRYANLKTLIITANHDLEETCEALGKDKANGEALISRLASEVVINVIGADGRRA